MKSGKNNNLISSQAFWYWFASNAPKIASMPENHMLIDGLERRVSSTWPRLSWEIGPDTDGGWYFALSPNLNKELLVLATEAISYAPRLPGWKFYATKQKKHWDGKFELETSDGIKQLDSANWQFVFLKYPDLSNELIFISSDASLLIPEDRWQAVAVVVEGVFGEKWVLTHIDAFSLEPFIEARLSSKVRPISLLTKALG